MYRFCVYCRVSTTVQEQQGQSLEAQEKILSQIVKNLNCEVVTVIRGQESAYTQDDDNVLFVQLINLIKSKIINAVIVMDISRLSRNNEKFYMISSILKQYNCKLFIQSQEYDLNDPSTTLLSNILVSVGQFQRDYIVNKSIEVKLELAKNGYIVFGKYPFGRRIRATDNKNLPAQWYITDEGRQISNDVFNMYINKGYYAKQIGDILNIHESLVFRILRDKPTFDQKINYQGEDIIIQTDIPQFYNDEQHLLINIKTIENRKNNGKVNDYLLSGLIKCECCNLVYVGKTIKRWNKQYYTHSKHGRTDSCILNIPLNQIDDLVLSTIGKTILFDENLYKAISSNDNSKLDEMNNTMELLKAHLNKLQKKQKRLLSLLTDDDLSDDDNLKSEYKLVIKEINKIEFDINQLEIEIKASSIKIDESEIKELKQNYLKLNKKEMTFKDKHQIIEWFFSVVSKNRKGGIFVKKDNKTLMITIRSGSFATLSSVVQKEDSKPVIVVGDPFARNHTDEHQDRFGYIDRISLMVSTRLKLPR